MKHIKYFTASLLLVIFAGMAQAQETTTTGVVVSTNDTYQTITVRDDTTGQRNTYFIGESTDIKSTTGPLNFDDIRRGQAVELVFNDTDKGRELGSFTASNPDESVEIVPIEFEDHYTITGEVVGTRPSKRTITIRPEGEQGRRTINVPEGVTISRNGKFVEIEDLLIGDTANFRYQETVQGYVLVQEGESVEEAVADATEAMENDTEMDASDDVLPATASNHFAWLITAFSLMLLALGMMVARRNAA